jgi:hypothetical protein
MKYFTSTYTYFTLPSRSAFGTLVRFLLITGHVVFFVVVLNFNIHAQSIGNSGTGSTNYLQTNVGSTSNGTDGSNSSDYLIADRYTTTVPLNVLQIRTYGNAGGNAKVAIYDHDAANNRPDDRLFTEVASAVNNGSWTTFTITDIYLPPGTYWIVANMSVTNGIRRDIGIGTTNQRIRTSSGYAYANSFPANGSAVTWYYIGTGNESLDDMYFVGVSIQGYAKATKATLPVNGTFSSVSFYTHAAGNARLSVYNDASGAPSSKQWESGDITINATGQPKWTTVNINSGSPASLNLSSGTYWLTWQWNTASNGPSYTLGGAGTGNYLIQSYGGFPATWTGGTASTENWSIYATYCATPAAPTAGNNGPVCEGSTLSLTASTISGATYSWTGPNSFTSNQQNPTVSTSATSAMAGTYSVTATVSGCTGPAGSTAVTVHPQPLSSVNGQSNISCYGGSNGTITISASGGTVPYSYSVNDGSNWISSGTNPYVYGGLSANQAYRVRVKDYYGCISE